MCSYLEYMLWRLKKKKKKKKIDEGKSTLLYPRSHYRPPLTPRRSTRWSAFTHMHLHFDAMLCAPTGTIYYGGADGEKVLAWRSRLLPRRDSWRVETLLPPAAGGGITAPPDSNYPVSIFNLTETHIRSYVNSHLKIYHFWKIFFYFLTVFFAICYFF